MISPRLAAQTFAILVAGVVLFQLALALGAPLGRYAMGGAFPGAFPPAMRVAAVVQALVLAGLAAVVLARVGVAFPRMAPLSRRLVWGVVAISAVSMVLNIITPSGGERLIWAPVAILLFLTSLRVARSR